MPTLRRFGALFVGLWLLPALACNLAAPPAAATGAPATAPTATAPARPVATVSAGPTDAPLAAGLSQAEAAELVLAQLVQPLDPADPLIVFAWPQPLTPQDQLQAYAFPRATPAPQPAVITGESWFFWIEDYPGALFAHPSRFVLVERATGSVTAWDENWWPTLNGSALWPAESDYWNEANWVFSNNTGRPINLSAAAQRRSTGLARAARRAPASPGDRAVVANAHNMGERLGEEFETSANQMYDALTASGFTTTYFTHYNSLGNPSPAGHDVFGVNDFYRAISDAAQQMQAGETFVLYLAGHGLNSEDGLGEIGDVLEGPLADSLRGFAPGVHVVVILDACYSGTFIDSLTDIADVIITSSSDDRPGYGDLDWEDDPNPEDTGLEFSSGFIEDWNLIEADPVEKKFLEDAEGQLYRLSNYWERLAAESYLSGADKMAGRTDPVLSAEPQYAEGSAKTKPAPLPTGAIAAVSAVVRDIAEHLSHIGWINPFGLRIKRGSVIFDGDGPWVDVEGEWANDGTFRATGTGTVAGFPNVSVVFTGTLTADGLHGYYTMGAGGELPHGEPIIFQIDGQWTERDPLPPVEPGGLETPEAFLAVFGPALAANDQPFLLGRLHPAVFERYGREQCAAYFAQRAPEPDLSITPTGPATLGNWDWVLDGRTTPLTHVLAVPVDFTRGGQTEAVEVHLASLGGRLYWFTDCGEPLP